MIKISSKLEIYASIFASALIFSQASALAKEFTYTVNEGASYSTQQNDVTSGTVIINGNWITADKRVIANTKEKSAAYGLISVGVGSKGIVRSGGDDVFKFSEFTSTQNAKGALFFELTNSGLIDYTGLSSTDPGRIIQAKDVVLGAIRVTNNAGGTMNAVDEAFKFGGKAEIINNGIIEVGEGQVADFGEYASDLESVITNAGTMKSAGNEVISGFANVQIVNSGLIETTDTGASSAIKVKYDEIADALAKDSSFTTGSAARLTLDNAATGVIRGTKHGVTGDRASAITNNGAIEGLGGSGINWDWASGQGEYVVTVNNTGSVKGTTSDFLNGDGDGIDIDLEGDITNSGTIIGENSSASADAIAIGGGIIRNQEGGIIRAKNDNAVADNIAYGILADNSDGSHAFKALRIENDGLIEGLGVGGVGIRLNSDKQNIIVNGGTVRGESGKAIILGDGGDKIIMKTDAIIEGDIIGGIGRDTIEIDVGDGNNFIFSDSISGIDNIVVTSGGLIFDKDSTLTISLFADGTSDIFEGGIIFEDGAIIILESTETTVVSSYDIFSGATFGADVQFIGPSGYTLDLSGLDGGIIGFNAIPEPSTTAAFVGFISLVFISLRKRLGSKKSFR